MIQIEGQLNLFDYLAAMASPSRESFDPLRVYALRGSMFSGGKTRILNFFKDNTSKSDRVKFLKEEYGIGGFSGPCGDKSRYQLLSGDTIGFGKNKGKVTLGWNEPGKAEKVEKAYTYSELAEMIDTLIMEGVYNG